MDRPAHQAFVPTCNRAISPSVTNGPITVCRHSKVCADARHDGRNQGYLGRLAFLPNVSAKREQATCFRPHECPQPR
jgi:hypothetical protein